jgi:hypothetical protein
MKLYAIRDKKTGMFWEFDESIDNWVLSNTWATVLQTKEDLFEPEYLVTWAKENANFYKVEPDLEHVTFREEPTEPCPECKERPWVVGTNQWGEQEEHEVDWEFCPYCGRCFEDI